MAWPTTAVVTGDLITAAQLNLLPIRLADSGVLGSDQASIDFTSIPGVFTHLLVVIYARTDQAGAADSICVRMNNDSTGNYLSETIYAFGATVATLEEIGTTKARAVFAP